MLYKHHASPTQSNTLWRSIVGRIIGVFAALIVAGLPLWGTSGAYAAIKIPHTVGPGYTMKFAGTGHVATWLGAYENPKGGPWLAWCKEIDALAPEASDMISVTHMESNQNMIDLGGADVDLDSNAQMAWILEKYEKVQTADSRAAIAAIVHLNFDATNKDSWKRYWGQIQADYPGVVKLVRQYVAEAKGAAVHGWETAGVGGDSKMEGVINNIAAKSRTGAILPGIAVSATLNGPAVFKANGKNTWEGVTEAKPLSLAWRATGNGNVSYSVDFSYKSGTQHVQSKPGRQDVLFNDFSLTRKPGPRGTFKTVLDFQPMAVSNVGDAKELTDPTMVSDTLQVMADPTYGSGDWLTIDGKPVPVTFTGTAYYTGETLPPMSSTVPEGAIEIGHTTITATGEGPYKAQIKTKGLKSGFVTWVWQMVKADQGEWEKYIHADWTDGYAIGAETSVIPFNAKATSNLKVGSTPDGMSLTDDLWITGMPAEHGKWKGAGGFSPDEANMTQDLLFFPKGLEVTEANKDKAEKIGSTTVPAVNGYHPAVGHESFKVKTENGLPVEGTYVFVTTFKGDARVKAFTTSVTDKREQYQATRPAPVLATTASDQEDGDKQLAAKAGVKILDRVCYKHLEIGKEYKLEGTLMDAATNQPLMVDGKPIIETIKHTPTKNDDCVDVVFTVDGAKLAGHKTVVFERAFHDGQLVAAHTDIHDAGQTVTFNKPVTPKPAALAKTGANGLSGLAFIGIAAASATGIYLLRRTKPASHKHAA